MYISPFWGGITVTLLVEFVSLMAYALYIAWRNRK